MPAADPSAPAEVLTQALRAAGLAFEVETIERTPTGRLPPAAQRLIRARPSFHHVSESPSGRQLTDTAYLAAATALLWVGLYYLPVGGALFRLALPCPWLCCSCANGRCAVEGVTVAALLLVALMGPIRGPLVLSLWLLALWLGWCWSRRVVGT